MSDTGIDTSMTTADMGLLETGNFADGSIVCGDRTWKVHKFFLASRSKWFAAAFYGGLKEAITGKIVMEEQDPNLIGIMIQFIYHGNINIPELTDGKDISGFCVRLFRVGDMYLLDELKEKIMTELEAHLKSTLIFLTTQSADSESPTWLTEILNAVEDAYKDISTEPILEALLKFVCMNKHKIFRFKDAISLVKKIPEMALDLMNNGIFDDCATQPRPLKFRLGLPVLAACRKINRNKDIYESGYAKLTPDGSATLPCLLCPAVDGVSTVFRAMNPETDEEFADMEWLSPCPSTVNEIRWAPESEIVIVGMCYRRDQLHIRFDDCGDARLYVERYSRFNPKIKQHDIPRMALEARWRSMMFNHNSSDTSV